MASGKVQNPNAIKTVTDLGVSITKATGVSYCIVRFVGNICIMSFVLEGSTAFNSGTTLVTMNGFRPANAVRGVLAGPDEGGNHAYMFGANAGENRFYPSVSIPAARCEGQIVFSYELT